MEYKPSAVIKRIAKRKRADIEWWYMHFAVTGELYGQTDELRDQLYYLRRVYARRWGGKALGRFIRSSERAIEIEVDRISGRVPAATSLPPVGRL